MLAARREVGALTRELQRCLPLRMPRLEADTVARGFLQMLFGRGVQVVAFETVEGRRVQRG